MSDLFEATRRRVREHAGNRCEYCLSHQDYVMGRLQIDHIQPVAKGGSDDDGPTTALHVLFPYTEPALTISRQQLSGFLVSLKSLPIRLYH